MIQCIQSMVSGSDLNEKVCKLVDCIFVVDTIVSVTLVIANLATGNNWVYFGQKDFSSRIWFISFDFLITCRKSILDTLLFLWQHGYVSNWNELTKIGTNWFGTNWIWNKLTCIHHRPWAAIYPPSPPPRGILQGYIFLKAYTKCYTMSHVSTLAVGAFRIFGVKREEIMQKSLKIGNNF